MTISTHPKRKQMATKNQLKRYAIIINKLNSNLLRPVTKIDLIESVEFHTSRTICESSIEKDIFFLRNELEAPIIYKNGRGYVLEFHFDLLESLKSYLGLFIN